jgi:hypothetical protein
MSTTALEEENRLIAREISERDERKAKSTPYDSKLDNQDETR